MLPENATRFPLDKNDPLSFVDHALLALVQVKDVYALNDVLGAFLTDDVVAFVNEHKEMFSVLSGLIKDKVRETVFDVDDMTFPDGLLMIPPLFDQLGWDRHIANWTAVKNRYQTEFEKEPCLTYALALLFLNALQNDMLSAFEGFEENIKQLTGEDVIHAERYLESLQYFGWPTESSSLTAS